MLNTSEHCQIDLSAIDMRTITPEEWEALKRMVIQRARAERAKAMRELLTRFRCWRQAPRRRVELLPT